MKVYGGGIRDHLEVAYLVVFTNILQMGGLEDQKVKSVSGFLLIEVFGRYDERQYI